MKAFFMGYVKQLYKSVKFISGLYFGSSLLYTCVGSCNDSKSYLMKYRNNELGEYTEEKNIKSEWDAVKYGSKVNFAEIFFNAVIWPYSITKNIIQSIVLMINNENKKE